MSSFYRTNTKPAMASQKSAPITLTSTTDRNEQRHLVVTTGAPINIGRASKSEAKNLNASPTNALFDNPVVSRVHAELKMNQWAGAFDQIQITDKGSTHGTRVNGKLLTKNAPMSLRSGDVIQLGAQVVRDQETHNGVSVTFDRVRPRTPTFVNIERPIERNIERLIVERPPVPPRRGIHVPSDSDLGSEYSDDEGSSVGSVSNKAKRGQSSACSSPEQSKKTITPGTAERPIDVDRPTYIDLDSDDESYSPAPAANSPLSRTLKFKASQVIKDTYAEDAGTQDKDSFMEKLKPGPPPGMNKDGQVLPFARIPYARVGDDDDSVVGHNGHNTGLTSILVEGADEPIDPYEDGKSEDELSYHDEDEHVHDDDVSCQSDGDSELNDCYGIYDELSDEEDDEEADENQENLYSAQKEPSPELGSAPSQSQKPVPELQESALSQHPSDCICTACSAHRSGTTQIFSKAGQAREQLEKFKEAQSASQRKPIPTTTTHYDPVRASQTSQSQNTNLFVPAYTTPAYPPPLPKPMYAHTPSMPQAPPAPPAMPKPYVLAHPDPRVHLDHWMPSSTEAQGTAADLYSSSRWDIPPRSSYGSTNYTSPLWLGSVDKCAGGGAWAPHGTFSDQHAFDFPSNYTCDFGSNARDSYADASTNGPSRTPFGAPHVISSFGSSFGKTPQASDPDTFSTKDKAKKSRMSIPELVEEPPAWDAMAKVAAEDLGLAPELTNEDWMNAIIDEAPLPTTSNKRKAAEMSEEDEAIMHVLGITGGANKRQAAEMEEGDVAVVAAAEDAREDEDEVVVVVPERPAQRRKTKHVPSNTLVAAATKYVAAGGLGVLAGAAGWQTLLMTGVAEKVVERITEFL